MLPPIGWPAVLAAGVVALVAALPAAGRTVARQRLGATSRPHRRPRPRPTTRLGPSAGHPDAPDRPTAAPSGRGGLGSATLASLALGAALALLLPAPLGPAAGLAAAVVLPGRLRRLEPAAHRREQRRIAADAPLAAELFAACVLGGADPVTASSVVARAVGGPLGQRLEAAATAIRLGSDPASVWAGLGSQPGLAGWGSALARASSSGAPVATVVLALAEQARAARRSRRSAAVRRASVWATLPLGVCFLPAFLLLGVVPVAVGVAGPVLGTLR